MKGKDELEGTRSNFTPWMHDFEHQGENCLGGCCNPPLGELGLIKRANLYHRFVLDAWNYKPKKYPPQKKRKELRETWKFSIQRSCKLKDMFET